MHANVKTHFVDIKCNIVVPLSLPVIEDAADRAVVFGSIRLMIEAGPSQFQHWILSPTYSL